MYCNDNSAHFIDDNEVSNSINGGVTSTIKTVALNNDLIVQIQFFPTLYRFYSGVTIRIDGKELMLNK